MLSGNKTRQTCIPTPLIWHSSDRRIHNRNACVSLQCCTKLPCHRHLYAVGKTFDLFIWNSKSMQDEGSVCSVIMVSQALLAKGGGGAQSLFVNIFMTTAVFGSCLLTVWSFCTSFNKYSMKSVFVPSGWKTLHSRFCKCPHFSAQFGKTSCCVTVKNRPQKEKWLVKFFFSHWQQHRETLYHM